MKRDLEGVIVCGRRSTFWGVEGGVRAPTATVGANVLPGAFILCRFASVEVDAHLVGRDQTLQASQ